MTEQELTQGLKKGEEAAFKKAFFTYFEPLTYYALRYLGDADAAQDVVQEVFTYLYEHRNTLEIHGSLKSFLYKSVGNRSLNVVKHHKVREKHADYVLSTAEDTGLDESMELAELEARIAKLIEELPPECSRIFKMSRQDQMSNQEIADALNLSKRTVETQISKALKVLKTALKIMLLQLFLKNF